MRCFLRITLVGGLFLAATSLARAQVGIAIGNPYTGGVAVGTPGYTWTGPYVKNYGPNSFGGYGATGYGYANGVSSNTAAGYGSGYRTLGYAPGYRAPATTYYGSGYRGYAPPATTSYRYGSYTYPGYSYPSYGYRSYGIPYYGNYGRIWRAR